MSQLSRRSLVTSAAALPALAMPAVANEPDPIFAAIQAHRKASANFDVCVSREFAVEGELPRSKRQSWVDDYEQKIAETDDPRWIAAIRATKEAGNLTDAAAMALTNIEPTTIAGVCALLKYFSEVQANGGLWPELGDDDDDGVLSFNYFIARNAACALAKMVEA